MKKQIYVLFMVLMQVSIASSQPAIWTRVADAPQPFAWAGCEVLGNYFYCFGCNLTTPVAQAFNLTTEQWAASTQPSLGWGQYGSAVTDSAIYLVSWFAFPQQIGSEVQKFVPFQGGPTGTWTLLASYPLAIAYQAVAWDGGNYIYAAGGKDATAAYSQAYRYDIANDTWAPIADMPFRTYYSGGAFISGKFYVVGGLINASALLEYNPAHNVWTVKTSSPLGIPAAFHCTSSNDTLLYTVGGGSDPIGPTSAVQIYNPLTDTWALDTPLPETTANNSARFVPPARVISAGGKVEGQVLSITYRGDDFPTSYPSMDVTLEPINPPIFIPSNGGSFDFDISVIRTVGPQAPYVVWARLKNPDSTYSSPTLGPVTINTSVGVTVTRQRTQTVPETWAEGLYTYVAYVNPTFTYPVVDSSSFTFTKSAGADAAPFVSDAECFGELFSGEIGGTRCVVSEFHLIGAYPNPFNPTTAVRYQMPDARDVSLKIYDTAGRLVATLVNGMQAAGTHQATFDGSNLSSGIYLSRLTAGSYTAMQKLVLLK
jgi:hypothetical protein